MYIERLHLVDWRSWEDIELEFASEGITVLTGSNGVGKTSILEAVGWLCSLDSFRGAGKEAVVRQGKEAAFLRGEGYREGRRLLVELELRPGARDRVFLNRQVVRKRADLAPSFRSTFFTPDDLELVKGGPSERRRFLDDLLLALSPSYESVRGALERVLRQRSMLLRQMGGRVTGSSETALSVWDSKLAEVGEEVVRSREEVLGKLGACCSDAYASLDGGDRLLCFDYKRSWDGPLREALQMSWPEDLRRGVTSIGPHRDEVEITLGGMPARTQASQGEQRSVALSMRLGAYEMLAAELDSNPILLLDDVLSELDEERSHALLGRLSRGQILLTSVGRPPHDVVPASTLMVTEGVVRASLVAGPPRRGGPGAEMAAR